MLSASKIEETRWATTMIDASLAYGFKAARNLASVLKSNALKLSSKIYISGFLISALAIANLCFCPPEKFLPP